MLTQSELTALELVIDAHGLSKTLDAIAEICAEKAAHVGVTWTDRNLEARWNRCAARVSKSAASVLRLDPLAREIDKRDSMGNLTGNGYSPLD